MASNRSPLLSISSLKYKGDNGFIMEIPRLTLCEGRSYAITGANGAGKTTLLRILALLTPPSSGSVQFEGNQVLDPSDTESARRRITLVMQDAYLFRTSVFDNVACGLRFRGISRDEIERKTDAALAAVGLSDFGGRKAQQLSRGETQRAAIARALVLGPRLLLLDEPTASVDSENAGMIEDIIKNTITPEGTAVVFSTHQVDQAYKLADEVVTLKDGVMLETGPTNLFEGVVVTDGGGTSVRVAPGMYIQVLTDREDTVHLRIPPEDIIISRSPIESSARNSFQGTITSASVEGDHIRLQLDIGLSLVVAITIQSFADMQLTVQDTVFATFKTSAVKVY